MSEEVKVEVIRNTQDSLSKYIKKPPLTEKLLRKPPFRYLHDITTSVMKETGYLQGLYSQDELNPENIKDRDAKIYFLEKLIAAVNLSTGVNISARPSKIVAGLDVAKTNELLQTIAKALDKNVDSSKAVEQVLNKKSKGVNQQSSSKKESVKSKPNKETKHVEAKSKEPRTSEALKKKTKEKVKTEVQSDSRKTKPKKDVAPIKVVATPSVDQPEAVEPKDDSEPREVVIPDLPATSTIEQQINTESNAESSLLDSEPNDKAKPPASPPLSLPTSTIETDKQDEESIPTRHKPEVVQEEVKSKREESSKTEDFKRPQSARAVHRKKSVSRKPNAELDVNNASKNVIDKDESVSKESKEIVSVETKEVPEKKSLPTGPTGSEETVKVGRDGEVVRRERPKTAARPASARPGAPRVRDRGTVLLADTDNKVVSEPVNLIVDSKDLLKNVDDETLVTVETAAVEVIPDQVGNESQLVAGDQGHLVSQILETQKELEDTSLTNSAVELTSKVDISWSSGRQEAVVREVDKLRSAIQALTRAANPLGKLIDCLQEDIESMQGELEMWTQTNHQLTQQLQAEERLTEDSVEPLAKQLEDISQLVEEQLEETSIVKATIIRNDERIMRLLSASRPPR